MIYQLKYTLELVALDDDAQDLHAATRSVTFTGCLDSRKPDRPTACDPGLPVRIALTVGDANCPLRTAEFVPFRLEG